LIARVTFLSPMGLIISCRTGEQRISQPSGREQLNTG
jgi:hypothetical protein